MQLDSPLIITNHALQRYLERSVFVKFNKCKQTQQINMILSDSILKKKYIDELLLRIKSEAEEERWLFNNTEFTSYIYEKYGYDQINNFYMDSELIYIIKKDRSGHLLLTCIPVKQFKITRNRKPKVRFKNER